MTSTKTPIAPKRRTHALIIFLLVLFVVPGCREQQKPDPADSREPETIPGIAIVTTHMDFKVQDTIKSGWQTFRYTNNSREPHFFLLEKYPEGKSIDNARKEIIPVFQQGMDHINKGDMEAAMAAFGALPEWFPEIVFWGGSGLISPGETAVSTLPMAPGYYVMECYVKMENGVFHSAMGMVEDLVVMRDSTGMEPPAPTVSLSLSKEEGIVVHDTIREGMQVFAVTFSDQGPHEHFIGHDVNLLKLGDDADVEAIAQWMNWTDPKGLISPPPRGVTFLGGVNEMPAGQTAYFTVSLTPGRYALISEVPNPAEKKMLRTFQVMAESP